MEKDELVHELAQYKISKQAALTLGAQQAARLDTFEKDLAYYQVGRSSL